jgi:hypothetical protein
MTEDPTPSPLPDPSRFERAATPRRLHHPERTAGDTITTPARCQPTSNRRQRPDWFTVRERRAEHLKPTPLGATRLAGGPGTPVRFTLQDLTRFTYPADRDHRMSRTMRQ